MSDLVFVLNGVIPTVDQRNIERPNPSVAEE